jgi:hypothetical protein
MVTRDFIMRRIVMIKDTGGTAFPTVNYVQNAGVGASVMELRGGMTLRDYFAAEAMQGFISNTDLVHMYNPENMAKWAYERADAMLKARES